MYRTFNAPGVLVLILALFCAGVCFAKAPAQRLSPALLTDDSEGERIIAETPEKILWSLPDNSRVTLTKRPKRVAVLLTSLLSLWYETSGTAIARCTGNLNVPEPARNLPELGSFNHPNAEKLIALKPDLVISSNLPGFRRLIPILKENGIEYAYFNYTNVYDYTRILRLFSKLNGTEDKVSAELNRMQEAVGAIRGRVSDFPSPRVLVVFSTANSVSCELETSQTGVMLKLLGAKNIIPPRFARNHRTRVQFSLERIVSLDPDFILLNTMGDVDECTERLESEFAKNPSWGGLRAIREHRFFVLPKNYFLFKPNAAFPDALKYLADLLYGKNQ